MTYETRAWHLLGGAMVVATSAFAPGCAAPRAEPIEGDVASALAIGIADGDDAFDHDVWDELLLSYARDEGEAFDYGGLKTEEAKLDRYLSSLAEANLTALNAAEIQALFINAYNAYTVKSILDEVSSDGSFAIGSIRDITDVWSRAEHEVGGYLLSLDNMEHNVLRPMFKDPRIHFAVNCASLSCPALPPRAFTGEALDEQLDAATRAALSSEEHVRINGDVLLLSKLLDWYGGDFVTEGNRGAEGHLADYVAKYTRDEVREWLSGLDGPPAIRFLDYDWGINQSARTR